MAKRFLEDMIKIKRAGAMAKPLPKVEIENTVVEKVEKKGGGIKINKVETIVREPVQMSQYSSRPARHRYFLWFVALVSAVFLIFAVSFLFSRATVTINPKVKDLTLNEKLSAVKDSSSEGLSFDLVAISGEETKTVEAKTQKDVAFTARGSVIIYNNNSSAPQPLNIDTRLEGSNGKMYKTVKKIIVPGKSGNTPGAIQVDIYANSAGAEYNSAPLDFKIFGFKGAPKYAKFYARSKGDISGGFKGKANIVSDEDKVAATTELKAALQAKLLQKAKDQIPSGFILFANAAHLETDETPIPFTSTSGSIPINIKGTFYGILFNESKLTKKIAKDNVENFDGSEVYIPKIRDLNFAFTDAVQPSFSDMKNINFSLSGAAKIVWKFDSEKLVPQLLGKSKNDFNQTMIGYPNVESALLKLTPPWIWSIPSKMKDIKVIVNYPK